MGAVHFEECLVRMCALLADQWEDENPGDIGNARAPDVLNQIVVKHINIYCERLHHIEFGRSMELSRSERVCERVLM